MQITRFFISNPENSGITMGKPGYQLISRKKVVFGSPRYIYIYVIVALCISYVSVGVAFRRSKRSTFRRSKRSTFRHSKRTPGRDIGGSLQITAKFNITTSLHHCLMCFCDKIVIIYIHLFTASCATTSCGTIVLYVITNTTLAYFRYHRCDATCFM